MVQRPGQGGEIGEDKIGEVWKHIQVGLQVHRTRRRWAICGEGDQGEEGNLQIYRQSQCCQLLTSLISCFSHSFMILRK